MKRHAIRLCLLMLLIFLLAACGDDTEPTPTPTKTPEPTSGEPAVVAPTNTPAAQPANNSGAQPAPADTAKPAAPPAAQEQTTATVNADGGLNLRGEANSGAAVIRIAEKGESFVVVGKSDDGQWVQVAQNGQTLGWLAAEFLDIKNPQPVAQTPATGEQPAATAAPVNNAPVPSLAMRSPEFGAQAFLWWKPEIGRHDLELMKKANFDWVKQAFAWETIEGAGRGQYDWTRADVVVGDVNASGLKLLARLSYDPKLTSFWAGAPPQNGDAFAEFAGSLAARYNCTQPGRCIHAFQIWNEPNLAREWGGKRPNPAEYVQFLGKAYRAIKAVHPNAIVISAGMAPTGSNDGNAMPDDVFYEEMYKAMGGSSNGYFDMLGVHGAGFAAPPELDPAEAAADKPKYGGYRFFAFRHVEDIRAIMERYGDSNKKIVLLEFGWTFDSVNPDYKWHGADAGITDRVQADYLKRAYQYAAANWPWVGLMSLLTMPNPDWLADGNPKDEEQYWWAIMEPADTIQTFWRPAFIELCIYFNSTKGQRCEYDPNK